MDLYQHLLAVHLAGRCCNTLLLNNRVPNSMVHRNAHGAQPLYLVVSHYNPLLGEPAHPHNIDEVLDPRQWSDE